MKTKTILVGYGIEVIIPKGDIVELINKNPATHGLNDCGHHYNIFENDDGFPQDRFYNKKGIENE